MHMNVYGVTGFFYLGKWCLAVGLMEYFKGVLSSVGLKAEVQTNKLKQQL